MTRESDIDRSVIVDVHSGLGNQMFQFAAGLGLARRNGCGLLVHRLETRGRAFLLDRFAIDLHFAPPGHLKWSGIRHYARRLNLIRPAVFWERTHAFDDQLSKLKPPVWIHGYFQSELYFIDIADEIRRSFVLKSALSPRATELAQAIDRTALPVSIHVRRGDYMTGADDSIHFALDIDYYRRATALVAALLGREPGYFIFSDDPGWAANALRFIPNQTSATVDLDKPEEDLILMSHCAHHIIANSTFIWWSAWLIARRDKIVVAPSQWFTPAGERRLNLCDLRPAGWILV
jgi:hypothetical protein